MKIKVIKTKKDYETALKAIESLWNAKPNTLQGEKLDLLTTLVESYEDKKYEILPPHPLEAIKFRMEQEGLTNAAETGFLKFSGKNAVSPSR